MREYRKWVCRGTRRPRANAKVTHRRRKSASNRGASEAAVVKCEERVDGTTDSVNVEVVCAEEECVLLASTLPPQVKVSLLKKASLRIPNFSMGLHEPVRAIKLRMLRLLVEKGFFSTRSVCVCTCLAKLSSFGATA